MQSVVALAREKHLLLQTGFMWRYNPGFTAVVDAVRQGWLGDVFLVRGYVSNNVAPARRPAWAEFAGGSMFELGSHLVDATVRLLGRPRAVSPYLRRHGRYEDSLMDNNVAVLDYDRLLVDWDFSTVPTTVRSTPLGSGRGGLAQFSPDGRWLVATEGDDQRVVRWDLSGSAPVRQGEISSPTPVQALGLSGSGEVLAIAGEDATVRWARFRGASVLPGWSVTLDKPVATLALDADGDWLAVGYEVGAGRRRMCSGCPMWASHSTSGTPCS